MICASIPRKATHGHLPLGDGRDDSRQSVHADALVRAFGEGVAYVRFQIEKARRSRPVGDAQVLVDHFVAWVNVLLSRRGEAESGSSTGDETIACIISASERGTM